MDDDREAYEFAKALFAARQVDREAADLIAEAAGAGLIGIGQVTEALNDFAQSYNGRSTQQLEDIAVSKPMNIHTQPLEESRIYCRQRIEVLEKRLRQLAHIQFSEAFGDDYFLNGEHKGLPIFNNTIRLQSAKRMEEHPSSFGHLIDTLKLEELIKVICKPDLYDDFFQPALEFAFPLGNDHARRTLKRLIPIRINLSHANPISVHDAERAVCYVSDTLESIYNYFEEQNMGREYNVPTFLRFKDSLGHESLIADDHAPLRYTEKPLHVGDVLRLEVEVESADADYDVGWNVCKVASPETAVGLYFTLRLELKHVRERLTIQAHLTQRKDWHKHGTYEGIISVDYRVLPP